MNFKGLFRIILINIWMSKEKEAIVNNYLFFKIL